MSRGYTNQGVCSFCCQADVVWIQHNLCNEPPCQVQSQRHGGLIEKLCIHFRHHLLVEVIAIWNVMYRLPTCHSCATDHPVIEHWGSLPIQSAILAMHFHPKLRQEAENCLLFIFRVPTSHQDQNFDCFRTMRVGEPATPALMTILEERAPFWPCISIRSSDRKQKIAFFSFFGCPNAIRVGTLIAFKQCG